MRPFSLKQHIPVFSAGAGDREVVGCIKRLIAPPPLVDVCPFPSPLPPFRVFLLFRRACRRVLVRDLERLDRLGDTRARALALESLGRSQPLSYACIWRAWWPLRHGPRGRCTLPPDSVVQKEPSVRHDGTVARLTFCCCSRAPSETQMATAIILVVMESCH